MFYEDYHKPISDLHKKELALKFQVVAAKFEKIFWTETNSTVRFNEPGIIKYQDVHTCNTTACHGGWAAVIFHPTTKRKCLDYKDGIMALNAFFDIQKYNLGSLSLQGWASKYHEYWGNIHGFEMFSTTGYQAFGSQSPYNVTLITIANHYRNVACRLLNDIKGD